MQDGNLRTDDKPTERKLNMGTIIKNSNRKLGKLIGNINQPAGVSCRPKNDLPCGHLCYGCKGNFKYKSVYNSIMNNYNRYIGDPDGFFNQINAELLVTPFSFIRWHSVGDIVDDRYLLGMITIARKNKHTKFLCFTKKYELVNKYLEAGGKIPRNLIIVFSNWGNWQCDNPFDLPTAWIKFKKTETYIPENAVECSGFCGACANTKSSCWKMKNGSSVFFNQH